MPQSDDSSDNVSPIPSSTDLGAPGEVDSLLRCLADRRRRLLIECLSDQSGPLVVEELVQHVYEREVAESADSQSDDERVEIAITLIHNHLPRLSEAGVIEVDYDTNTVGEGDRMQTAMALLRVV